MKILIIEDNPIIRMIPPEQLIVWGYDFDLAVNGREAVDYIWKKGVNYDLCLIDVNMPVMNGIEAIKAIRQSIYYIPIIAFGISLDYKVHCLEVGANEFLVKPLATEGVKEKLEEFAVKKIVLYLDGESLSLHRVGPADGKELNELRMLDKKETAKFTVIDVSFHFFANKHAQNKLLHDFGNGNSIFTEILDRTRQGHNVVQIHASQIWMRKSSLTPTQFRQLVREENEMMKKYKRP